MYSSSRYCMLLGLTTTLYKSQRPLLCKGSINSDFELRVIKISTSLFGCPKSRASVTNSFVLFFTCLFLFRVVQQSGAFPSGGWKAGKHPEHTVNRDGQSPNTYSTVISTGNLEPSVSLTFKSLDC